MKAVATKYACVVVSVVLITIATSTLTFAVDQEETLQLLEQYEGSLVTAITLQGHHVTRDFVIAREIWSEVGKPLDPQLVHEDVVRLENLSIFGSVIATPIPSAVGVTLNFHFTEMPWLIPYPALSYNEQNGFSIGLGVASPNLFGRKVSLSASVLFGGTTTGNFKASNPWITGNHVSGEIWAKKNVRQNVLLDFEENTDLLQVIGGSYIGHRGRFLANLGYYSVGSDKDGITLNPNNRDRMFTTGISLGYDSRDSWRVPHQGWLNDISPMYFGGDANSWTVNVDIRRFQPVKDNHTIDTGPLFTYQSGVVGEDVPSYLQFFLGGANTIRGYKIEELGKELFGKNQFLYTLEYRYVFSPMRAYKIFKWSIGMGFELAGFGDAGVAWSRSQDFSLNRTRFGYGVGLRVLLPAVQMIRFDVGISQFGDVVFNFGINSIFHARRLRIR